MKRSNSELSNKLKSVRPAFDKEALWDNIEEAMPAPKRKRRFAWWWLGALIPVVIVCLWMGTRSAITNDQASNAGTITMETSSHSSDPSTSQGAEAVEGSNVSGPDEVVKAETTKVSTVDLNADVTTDDTPAQTTASLQMEANQVQSSLNESATSPALATDALGVDGLMTEVGEASAETNKQMVRTAEQTYSKKEGRALLVYAQVESRYASRLVRIGQQWFDAPALYVSPVKDEAPSALSVWTLRIDGGSVDRSLASQTLLDFVQEYEDHVNVLSSVGAELQWSRQWSSGWGLGALIRYEAQIERYEDYRLVDVIETDKESAQASFYQWADGTTTFYSGTVMETTTIYRDVRSYNEHHALGIGLVPSYHYEFGNWTIDAMVGGYYVPHAWSSGTTLADDLTIQTLSSEYDVLRSSGYGRGFASLGVSRSLGQHMDVFADLRYTSDVGNRSAISGVTLRYRDTSVGIGMRTRF